MQQPVGLFGILYDLVSGLVGGLRLQVVVPIVAIMIFLRWRRVKMFAWALAWWFGLFIALKFGFKVPVPASVITLYMAIVTAALFAYVSSGRTRWQSFIEPVVRLVVEPKRRLLLVIVVVALPLVAATNVWLRLNVPLEAPAFGRSIHPAPPVEITVHDQKVDLVRGDNPYRSLETSDPAAFKEHVENGRRVFYQNCFYCHGDGLGGNGMFVHALNPIPTNFTDSGFLPILQDTFVFWRVSKGGPGLPEEGGPWDSAMPAWEKMLSTDEIWDVILFLYDYTGFRPRARQDVTAEGR